MLSHGCKHRPLLLIRNGGKRRPTVPRWTDCMSASYAPAARQPVRATGGTEIDSWGPQRSCMPGGGSSTLVMKPLVIGWTSLMIRSNCSDAVLFLTAQMCALKVRTLVKLSTRSGGCFWLEGGDAARGTWLNFLPRVCVVSRNDFGLS